MAGNLKLDSNHDIIIGRGATRVGGAEYVAQLVKCRLLTILGEWQNDTSLGLDWFNALLSKNTRVSDIQAAVANIIRSTNHVQQLLSIDVDANYKTRVLSISFAAISSYGNLNEILEWQQ